MKKKKLHLDYIPVFYIIFVCSFCKNANDDKGRDTRWWENNKKKKKHLNSWNSDSEKKLKNLVYYVKLLNIFIIMEIKNEWENAFFFYRRRGALVDRWILINF